MESLKTQLLLDSTLISQKKNCKHEDRLDFLTKDFGPGKGRKQLRLATHILVQLQEVLMKSPEIAVPLPHYYLHRERGGDLSEIKSSTFRTFCPRNSDTMMIK